MKPEVTYSAAFTPRQITRHLQHGENLFTETWRQFGALNTWILVGPSFLDLTEEGLPEALAATLSLRPLEIALYQAWSTGAVPEPLDLQQAERDEGRNHKERPEKTPKA